MSLSEVSVQDVAEYISKLLSAPRKENNNKVEFKEFKEFTKTACFCSAGHKYSMLEGDRS